MRCIPDLKVEITGVERGEAADLAARKVLKVEIPTIPAARSSSDDRVAPPITPLLRPATTCCLSRHETLHNSVDEALLLKEARSWSHANMPHANVSRSFQIRPCCIEQINQLVWHH
uniref:Uncharacterized protein n=1 Tax=Oryza barthii TaxID=65489 RepID=A0A0D3HUI2_9ORYZ